MSKLFENIEKGAVVGSIIGTALDVLFVGGAIAVSGPAGIAAAGKVAVRRAAVRTAGRVAINKVAAGTLIGAGAGVVKTINEEKSEKEKQHDWYSE